MCSKSDCTSIAPAARRENSPSTSRTAQSICSATPGLDAAILGTSPENNSAFARPEAIAPVIIVRISSIKKACASHSRIRTSSQGPSTLPAKSEIATTNRPAIGIAGGIDMSVRIFSLPIAISVF
jgi:hypothetical protein